MRVSVTFRHVNPSAGLRSYASEKVERLDKFARRILEAHVILTVEKLRHRAEIQLVGRDLNVTATEETSDLYSAIDLAVDKVERQLKKSADKRKTRKGAVGAGRRGEIVVADMPRRKSRLKAKRVAVTPMSIDEALLRIEGQQTDFLFFRDLATESLNVLYRRKDGSFALLQPDLS